MPGVYLIRDGQLDAHPPPRPADLLREARPPNSVADAREGELDRRPLSRLLDLLGGTLDELDKVIGALYDDHFVERASPEALTLIGELFSARLLGTDPRVNRAVVARTIAWRRRKGTLATIEEVLGVTSGWGTEVDEAFRSLLYTQPVNAVLPWRGRTTIVWDPIALADPLSRRASTVERPRDGIRERGPIVGVQDDETLDDALRRLGRADAGRHAASPRTIDLAGWARPEVAIVRTTKLVPVELEGVVPGPPRSLTLQDPVEIVARRAFRLDPADRDVPLVWLQPLQRPDTFATLTSAHEPDPNPATPARTTAALLTPTALAADGDAAEAAGALALSIDGIPIVGPDPVPVGRAVLAATAVNRAPVLRLADPGRPSPDDEWTIDLVAVVPTGTEAVAAVADPLDDVLDDDVMTLARTAARRDEVHPVEHRAPSIPGQSTVAMRIGRTAGRAFRRTAAGAWTSWEIDGRLGTPRSNAARVSSAVRYAVRAERWEAEGTLRLARMELGTTPMTWVPFVPVGDLPPDGPGMAAIGTLGTMYLVANVTDDAGAESLGVWRIDGLTAADLEAAPPTSQRIDDPDSPRRPGGRLDPSLTLFGTGLYINGGQRSGAILGDLWSISTSAIQPIPRPWRPNRLRNPQPRVGGALLATATELIRLGGQSVAGHLDTSAWRLDPNAVRPTWRALPDLPFEADLPGVAWARVDGDDVYATAWPDRTAPQALELSLANPAPAWTLGDSESAGPNPPAAGEAIYDFTDFWVLGPPPLPASEVIFTLGGESHLAFLPPVDLPADANADGVVYDVAVDGSTRQRFEPGELVPMHTRPGGALWSRLDRRDADVCRIGRPGRLARHRFLLRQRNLGRWDEPLVRDDPAVIALDPRTGRVRVPQDVHVPAETGRIKASYRIGRGEALGAGLLPADRQPPAFWTTHDAVPPVPPDLDHGGPSIGAYISPERAGLTLDRRGETLPIVADVAEARATTDGAAHPVWGVLGSARLEPVRLLSGVDTGFSLVATDFGSTPVIGRDPDDGTSMAVHASLGDDRADIWLAGLWFTGRVDLAVDAGAIDLRWCTIGSPDPVAAALRIAGGGHEGPIVRRTAPDVDVALRLYGCQIGALEIPSWVRLEAAGCTFDAGASDAPAIRAAGARVRLMHCTVRGQTLAGELEASSCAFGGPIRVDRPDLGWIRYSLLPPDGQAPSRHRSLEHFVSFASVAPGDPRYLVLAPNNGAIALSVAELDRVPGAHGARADRERELAVRTDAQLPIGMVAHPLDRAALDLFRMHRSPA